MREVLFFAVCHSKWPVPIRPQKVFFVRLGLPSTLIRQSPKTELIENVLQSGGIRKRQLLQPRSQGPLVESREGTLGTRLQLLVDGMYLKTRLFETDDVTIIT